MERKGTKNGRRAPPDAGLFWHLQLTESVNDGFPDELVELGENQGESFVIILRIESEFTS